MSETLDYTSDERAMRPSSLNKMDAEFKMAMIKAGYQFPDPASKADDLVEPMEKPHIRLTVCRICQEAIEEELVEKEKHPKTMKDIVDRVSRRYAVTVTEIRGKRKHKGIVAARHEAFWLIRHMLHHLSYPQIGKYFGGRDHSTVMHGVKKHQERVELAAAITKVRNK